ncbi:unnamed protein product [Caenorhabditis auriculariae]|uniref:beta-N-acetylhexosaminidase n=1 Tax=Caenorhabditis auriculariae TaxID=2777116 RepID=A0A8S1HX05_9PELO|nr:unnamed protein product [Caenorhabditis auriculariae]
MISGRYVRRRTMDLLVKGVILTTLIVFFIQMTTSYPKGGYKRQEPSIATEQQISVSKRENQKSEADKDVEYSQKQVEESKLAVQPVAVTEKKTSPMPTRKSRKGEFYENILIHFDLKGAPPKVPYFLDLLRLIAKGGATGILLEWEDMFPWTGELEKFKNSDAYSLDDVKAILDEARTLQLDVIPLVQTFGHLEWILKYEETRKYRENDAYPNVLCLGSVEGVKLVKEALRQVIDVHKPYGIPSFHIGADEAFEFGVCAESLEWIRHNGAEGGKQMLALAHLKSIAQYVKALAGYSTRVLAWHDMLKDFQPSLIRKLDLGAIIEPVVWDYSENIVTMNDHSFAVIAENFPTMWASSAFKGANFPAATFSDVRHYETNNRNWIGTKKQQQGKFQNGFRGIIITGWQRYDHMAMLCEILPMGTASLILNLQTALNAPNMDQTLTRGQAAKILGCPGFNVAGTGLISNQCTFKGFDVYAIYQGQAQNMIKDVEQELSKNHPMMGWGNRYNRRYNISQNWYHREMLGFVRNLAGRCDQVETSLRNAMKPLFFDNTIDEFIYENIGPTSEKLHNYIDEIQRLDQLRAWPKRNFPIKI